MHKLSESEIKAIESVLAQDKRVELIPVKDGIRVIRVELTEVKQR